MKKVAIIGAGHLGQHLAHFLLQRPDFELVGFYDDFQKKDILIGQSPVLAKTSNILAEFHEGKFEALLMGIGYRHMDKRAQLFEELSLSIPFANLIHPLSQIDPSVELGSGLVIFPQVSIGKSVKLGSNILLHTATLISHDSEVGSHSYLSPRVTTAGFCKIGHSCFLGINTTISERIEIAPGVQSGASTTFVQQAKLPGLYIGTPAQLQNS